jgi:TonB family protein
VRRFFLARGRGKPARGARYKVKFSRFAKAANRPLQVQGGATVKLAGRRSPTRRNDVMEGVPGFGRGVGVESWPMKASSIRWLLVCAIAALAVAFPLQARRSPTTDTQIEYANSSEGLRKLLDSLVGVARKNDRAELQRLIRNLEIPNYESWFTTTFGEDKGGGWAEAYGRWLAKGEGEFEELIFKLALMNGDFEVETFDTAKKYDTLKGPLDEYVAKWKAPATPQEEEPTPIGDFFFIDGTFRWNANSKYFPFAKVKTGRITPAKLIQQVNPVYPAEAREKKIEGTVKLQVLVRKDGTVTVQRVIEGDPVLSSAAIEAVQQWRFEPWQLNGQAIEMQSTVEVVFSLTPPH